MVDPSRPTGGERATEQAVSLDDTLAEAHAILGGVHVFHKRPEQALAEGTRAIALNPNYADGYAWLGFILSFTGKPVEGLAAAQQALRLSPTPVFFHFACAGFAYYLLRRYDEAMSAIKKSLALNADNAAAHHLLAVNYIEVGQKGAARTEIRDSLTLSRVAAPRRIKETLPFTDPAVVDRMWESTRQAVATLRVRDYVAIVIAQVMRYFQERRTRDTALS